MCGIIGILADYEVSPRLVDALRRLEYRGYDSAGIATVHDGHLDRRRTVGKLRSLSDYLVHNPLLGKSGIGHTRWATHGAPTVENAHPHQAGRVAVVHNGIIENYLELREELVALGGSFATDTDTETIALWTQYEMTNGLSLVEAARATIAKLEGSFALAFLFDGEQDLMIAARRGSSPLAVAHGEGRAFVGSDAIALASLTDKIIYLEEGDFAALRRESLEITDENGNRVRRAETSNIESHQAMEKSGHKHFMSKEIAEQPAVLRRCIDAYFPNGEIVAPDGLDFTQYRRVTMVACGTAFLACHVAKYWFEQLTRMPVEIDIASEYRYRKPPIEPDTLAIFVSQSGETADTLAALQYIKEKASKTVAVVNVEQSSIARGCDIVLPLYAGREIGVASTKAFTAQLSVLAILVLSAAQARQTQSVAQLRDFKKHLRAIPDVFNRAMAVDDEIKKLAPRLAEARDVLFLGRGVMYPIAVEGALKLKEISYIHAEGYAAGELKHGPIALVDQHVPVIVLAPPSELFDKTISNMQETMAREGKIVLITDKQGAQKAAEGVWERITLPEVDGVFAPILYALAVQLIAYHTAVAKGTDVDQPRNLAKSVTVE